MEQEGGEEGKKRERMEELKRVWKKDGGKDNGKKEEGQQEKKDV